MQIFPGCKKRLFPSSASVCFLLLAGVLAFAGCSKAKRPAAETPAPAAESVNPATADHTPVYAPTPAAAPVVIAAPNGEPDLGELNRSLLRWVLSNRRKPASFEDFAATAGVVIPPAPAGKKYVIAKDMHIQLVKK